MEQLVKVIFEQKTSKAGNLYDVIVITFKNGYTLEKYVTKESKFIIESLMK